MPRAQCQDTYKSGQKKTTLSSIFYTFYQKPYVQSTLKCQKPLISGQKRKKLKLSDFAIGTIQIFYFVACAALFGLN
jgi:hypothetical protein